MERLSYLRTRLFREAVVEDEALIIVEDKGSMII